MGSTISNKEAIEMMERCRHEIQSLRAVIDRLKPKAEAYDNLAVLIGLVPRQSVGVSEDLVWIINKRIKELQPKPAPEPSASDDDIPF